MNKVRTYRILYILALAAGMGQLMGQADALNARREMITTLSDRVIYAAGEDLYFSSRVKVPEGHSGMSKVLYVDLVTPDGQLASTTKHALVSGEASGALKIPEESPSGLYYLHSYTKWQRNFGAAASSFISVKIINPHSRDHLPVLSGGNGSKLQEMGARQEEIEDIEVLKGKTSYAPGEAVELEIANENTAGRARIIASVVPAGTSGDQWSNLRDGVAVPQEISYFPETRGISVSGQVGNGQVGKGVSYSKVFLTILDSTKSFYPVLADSLGRFQIALPDHRGMQEVFVSAEGNGHKSLKIYIDRDFNAEPLQLPSRKLELDSLESVLALQIARNQQLASYFLDAPPPEAEESEARLFYGEASRIVEFAEYIDLPSLSEYFLELLPMVQVIRNRDGAALRINGPQAEMTMYDPLVLIDGVAVFDIDAVLAIKPSSVSRIELVDRPWIRGHFMFGGIISIVSKRNDFAGVELPESGQFLTYRFFEEDAVLPQDRIPDNKHIPDCRNTLYWNPSLEIPAGGSTEISFKAPDRPGMYSLILRRIMDDGSIRKRQWDLIVE